LATMYKSGFDPTVNVRFRHSFNGGHDRRGGSALSIGIGGSLATSFLPHHRAYGSVPRRFGGLRMNRLCHDDKALTFEEASAQRAVKRFASADPPRSFQTHDRGEGRFPASAATPEFREPFAAKRYWSDLPRAKRSKRKIAETEARLPFHPRHAAQPPSDPAVEVFECAPLA
jgi:hypothetical protein